MQSVRLGNQLSESTIFNNRLQPEQIALGTSPNSTNLLKLDYEYGALNLGTGQTIAGTNNGNLAKQTITVPSIGGNPAFTTVQYYHYDALNRIQIASETITPVGQPSQQIWTQTFKYDRYGNREFDTNGNNTTTIPWGCPQAVCNPTPNPTNNRLNGYLYDNAGNTTTDTEGKIFTYDGENKQTKVVSGGVTVGEYFYDGDGKRVKKHVPSTGETTIFIYDAFGKMVAEYSTIVAPIADAKLSYLTTDHLGSPRINTDKYGQATSRHDYRPFGDEITLNRGGYGYDDVRKKFTGYERDIESELDFAQARYYNKNHGRFTRPDEPLVDQSEDDPQSWNLYLYAGNNPLLFTDPTGLWKWSDPDKNGHRFVEWEQGDNWRTLESFLHKETGDFYSESSLSAFYSGTGALEARLIVD